MDSDNKKITQLTQVTTLSDSDLFVVSIDVGTAPKTRGITRTNAFIGVGLTSYTPVLSAVGGTPPAIGNGTIVGKYTRTNGVVNYSIALTFGSTSTYGTGSNWWTLTLPPFTNLGSISGFGSANHPATGYGYGTILHGGIGGQDALSIMSTSSPGFITNVAPFTWASGDTLSILGSYLS